MAAEPSEYLEITFVRNVQTPGASSADQVSEVLQGPKEFIPPSQYDTINSKTLFYFGTKSENGTTYSVICIHGRHINTSVESGYVIDRFVSVDFPDSNAQLEDLVFAGGP